MAFTRSQKPAGFEPGDARRSAQDGLENSMKSYYKIQIAPSLHQQLGLKGLSFEKEQEAIDLLTESFNKTEMAFTLKEETNRKAFVNEAGGELAVIVPG